LKMNNPEPLNKTMKTKEGGTKRKLSCEGKRAAHVKWDGKTIALGTFPDEEAASMCIRAKDLTKTWRSMFPKPTVEWVRQSLERRGIRVVNNRPGRQPTKKENHGSPNQKLSFSTYQIQPLGAAAMNLRIDNITNIAEVGSISPANNEIQANSIKPRTPTTPIRSNQQNPSIRLQQGNDNPLATTPTKTEAIQTDSMVRDKNDKQLAHPDQEDLDLEMTYATLQKHRSNLKTEVDEIDTLLKFYSDERKKRRLIPEPYQKQQSKKPINQQISVKINPIIKNQTPNPPIFTNQFDDAEPDTNQPKENPDLYDPMNDTANNDNTDSVTRNIELEDWRL